MIVKTAEDCGLTVTSEVEYNRDDAINRNEGHYGILGVANFCFTLHLAFDFTWIGALGAF